MDCWTVGLLGVGMGDGDGSEDGSKVIYLEERVGT